MTRHDVEFPSDGVALRGWLFLPDAARDPVAAVVMAHGFGAVKEQFLPRFAERFADAGLAVILYDHPNFGASEGQPRDDADPWAQIRGYRNAISFAKTRPEIDPQRIGIWGSSYSGGHVLVVAATDARVRCVVAQVPTISGYLATQRRVAPENMADMQQMILTDFEATFAGAEPQLRTLVSDGSGSPVVFGGADAEEFFSRPDARPETWSNQVTLRSLERARNYEPIHFIERISPTPLLMVVADDDTVTLTDLNLAAYHRALEPKELAIIPGGHFAPYDSAYEVASGATTEFLVRQLAI